MMNPIKYLIKKYKNIKLYPSNGKIFANYLNDNYYFIVAANLKFINYNAEDKWSVLEKYKDVSFYMNKKKCIYIPILLNDMITTYSQFGDERYDEIISIVKQELKKIKRNGIVMIDQSIYDLYNFSTRAPRTVHKIKKLIEEL